VDEAVAGSIDVESEATRLPSFPEPDRPRKLIPMALDELTHESLPLLCYGAAAKKPLCIMALVAERQGTPCPASLTELARRHRNDNVQFGWVGVAKQADFLAAFGLEEASNLPTLVAVKPGKRPRFAKLDGGAWSAADGLKAAGAFVDRILGGDATFKRLGELPELEAPYLLESDRDGKAEL
jgi:hypothetical protein